MRRVILTDPETGAMRSYPAYAPRVVWLRVTHRLFGPLLGCSCSTCFRSRWRIAYSNPTIDRFVKNERRIEAIDKQLRELLPNYKRSFP